MTPSRFLIINADDLGISPEVNAGIFAAYVKGAVTDSSLLITGPSAQEAIATVKNNPSFQVGLHIDLDPLLGWESPGRERFSRPELKQMLDGSDFSKKIRNEIEAQITAFLDTGLNLSHVDTHHHVHGFPRVFELLIDALNSYQIKAIRFSKKGYTLLGREDITITAGQAQEMEDRLRHRGIAHPDLLIDPLFPFSLHALPAGVAELMAHPSRGGDEWRQKDFEMLMHPRFMKTVEDEGIRLIGFSELASSTSALTEDMSMI